MAGKTCGVAKWITPLSPTDDGTAEASEGVLQINSTQYLVQREYGTVGLVGYRLGKLDCNDGVLESYLISVIGTKVDRWKCGCMASRFNHDKICKHRCALHAGLQQLGLLQEITHVPA